SGLHFSAERFHTVTLSPVSISRSAIAAPILPRPATPTFMRFPLTRTRRTIGDRRTGRKPDDRWALPACPRANPSPARSGGVLAQRPRTCDSLRRDQGKDSTWQSETRVRLALWGSATWAAPLRNTSPRQDGE